MTTRAVLVDVYETVLTCDFSAHSRELPKLAGMDPATWDAGFSRVGAHIASGELSMAEAFGRILHEAGVPDDDGELAARLDARDAELLIERSHVHPDTVPFLTAVRARGISSALVSNCGNNTRAVLEHLGLVALVDATVLSNEVRSVKPEPHIYLEALAQLDVVAADSVFVDDQRRYCDGAAALGIRAVHLAPDGSSEPGMETVTSLSELADRLDQS